MRIVDPSTARFIAGVVVLLGLFWALYVLGVGGEKSLLRDRGVLPAGGLPSFSLARTQMAWWFGLIFASYLSLWVVCAELPEFSQSALILLGIASGTGMLSTSMDSPDRKLTESEGWLVDVTSDAEGVTLYRLQHLVWNVFFGLAFVIQVGGTLAMPEFDNMMLGLMGISAAAYVGCKIPEKKAEEKKSPAAVRADPADAKTDYGAA